MIRPVFVSRLAIPLLIMALVGLTSPSGGAEPSAPVIGFVDIAKVMMLHPLMREFDAQNHRFLLKGPMAGKKGNPAIKNIEGRIKTLKEEKTALDKAIAATEDRFLEKLRELAREGGTPPTGKARDEYNKKRRFVESDFRSQVREIRATFKAKEEQIVAAEQELSTAHLASHDETARIFKLMLDEIDQVVAQVAEGRNIHIVLNNSFSPDRVPRGAGDKISNPMPAFYDKLEAQLAGEEGETTLLSTLHQWSKESNWNLIHCLDGRVDNLVVRGGVDLTPAVVDGVLTRQKISEKHRQLIGKLFQMSNRSN